MTAVNLNRAVRGPVTAVPIVAGKGVRLVADTQNNRWVVEADETVLWGNSSGSASIQLSEICTNFERLRLEISVRDSVEVSFTEIKPIQTAINYGIFTYISNDGLPLQFCCQSYTSSDGINFTFARSQRLWINTSNAQIGDNNVTDFNGDIKYILTKVIGINRIASN